MIFDIKQNVIYIRTKKKKISWQEIFTSIFQIIKRDVIDNFPIDTYISIDTDEAEYRWSIRGNFLR